MYDLTLKRYPYRTVPERTSRVSRPRTDLPCSDPGWSCLKTKSSNLVICISYSTVLHCNARRHDVNMSNKRNLPSSSARRTDPCCSLPCVQTFIHIHIVSDLPCNFRLDFHSFSPSPRSPRSTQPLPPVHFITAVIVGRLSLACVWPAADP